MYRDALRPYRDKNTGYTTAQFQITKNCKNLIKTLPSLIHDETNVEDLNTNGDDHAADATRYGLMEL